MNAEIENYIEYCLSIAKEFEAKLNRFRIFVSHNLSSGTANEVILREFLSSHAPKQYFVGQGFICDPIKENQVSKQCDILVYDQIHHPVVYEDGPIKIVSPKSAKMVVEIKTKFNRKTIKDAIENIEAAKKASLQINGAIFGYDSLSIETISKHIREFLQNININYYPSAFLIFKQGIIIHQLNAKPNIFSVKQAKEKGNYPAITILYLLLIFFDSVWKTQESWDLNTKLLKMFDLYTEEIDSFTID